MIRFWEQKDVIQLRKLIKALLVNQEKYGSRIIASEHNIQWYLDVGYAQVKNGDPHLVYDENGEILAYIQLGKTLATLETRGKSAEIFGMYTRPDARGRFINIELIREMGRIAVDRGYTYIYSSILLGNSKSLGNFFHNPAIWPTSVHCEWALENDVQFNGTEVVKIIERKSA